MRPLPLMLLLACSSGPSDDLPSGSYLVTTTIVNAPVEWRFTVVSATAERVILDWTAGDVRGTFPVRDTASFSDGTYRVQWLGVPQGRNYWMRFSTGPTCEGSRFEPFLSFTGCTLSRST